MLSVITTGNYVNVATANKDGKTMDVFVILNEPNDNPTDKDVEKIIEITKNAIHEYSYPEMLIADFKIELAEELEDAPIGCTTWGVQILVSMD